MDKLARGAAEFLGLEYQRLHTGDGHLQKAMEVRVVNADAHGFL